MSQILESMSLGSVQLQYFFDPQTSSIYQKVEDFFETRKNKCQFFEVYLFQKIERILFELLFKYNTNQVILINKIEND